ncbi:MAG: DUF6456 domain-containing protein [Alphaproteobacteria bacterium]|nr:DUF6456 domain-containing protein [Alphaproteobacteria bacterium]
MGNRRRPVSTDRRFRNASPNADYGPAERWQHTARLLEFTERAGVLAARAAEENVVDVLLLRRWINATQREAALRFKRDYHIAGLEARLSGSYNPLRVAFSPFGPWDERSDAEEAAYQRWRNAVRALGAPSSDLVVTIVCYDRMPVRQFAARLQEGLDKLAKWYRMPETAGDSPINSVEKSGVNVDQTAAR